jgi:hypothetical protein
MGQKLGFEWEGGSSRRGDAFSVGRKKIKHTMVEMYKNTRRREGMLNTR